MKKVMKEIALTISPKISKKELGQFLRHVRRAQGRTQQHVATKLELPPTSVARIESGVMEPRVLTMARFCRALGRRLVLVVE